MDVVMDWLVPLLGTVAALGVASLLFRLAVARKNGHMPPQVPYWIPVIGSAVEFGVDPIKMLLNAYQTYGEVFSMQLLGRSMTVFVTPEAADYFVNARASDVSAEAAYAALTVPVFGKDVVYDVDYDVLVEQKKMVKSGLTREVFQLYVPMIQKEVVEYFRRWGNSGEANVFEAFSELAIMTASTCLMGSEIRSVLDEQVAKLYHDLELGFTPLNFMFPNVPFPGNYKRDVAQAKMSNLFVRIIKERRASSGVEHNDMLDNLMNQKYKNGEQLKDHQVAHLLIALLMAGQHTSSSTLAWMTCWLSKHRDWQTKLFEEQKQAIGGGELDYDTVVSMKALDLCLKETLRLTPPLNLLMRKVLNNITYKDYVIPAGHYVCVSPTITHRLPEIWKNPNNFEPDRFDAPREEDVKGGKFAYIPFGAGRHRCIGEQFAYLQVKTIMTTFLELFEFEADSFPETDFTSMVVLPKSPMVRYKRRVPLKA